MERLASMLPAALRRRGLYEQGQAALAVTRATQWIAAQAPALAQHVRVRHLKDGVLTVACDSPVAMQEMQALAHRLEAELHDGRTARCSGVRVQRA